MNHLDQFIVPAFGFIFGGFWLCQVIDVVAARKKRIESMRRAMNTMQEHSQLMHESAQLRSQEK